MSGPLPIVDRVVRDLVLLGLAGGLVAGLWRGEQVGWSFLAGCLWMALSFILLGWLLGGFLGSSRPSFLFIFILACAKIPAAYLLLYWLYRADYSDALGLTAGLLVFPLVLVYRGLAHGRRGEARQVKEKG